MREYAPTLKERLRKPAALAAMIGALAVPAAKAGETQPDRPAIEPLPEFIIAAQEDDVVNEDEQISKDVAKKLKELGVNAVKITAPWTYPAQCAEIDNDLKRYENAFQALKDEQLIPIVNLIPGGGAGLGKAPITPSQRTCYTDTLISYENLFKKVSPGGRLVFIIPNEPNLETFWRPQRDKDGALVAPKAVVNLQARSYWPVKKAAQGLGIGVTIVGGALASNHNPVAFTRAMGTARKELKHDGPIMDSFALHPYPKTNEEAPDTPHPDLSTIGLADLATFTEVVDNSFNKSMDLWLSEWTYKAKVPSYKLGLYSINPNKSPGLIDEATQADYLVRGLKIARCNPRIGALVLFNVIDDRKGQWASGGVMYPDSSPKPAYEPVRKQIQQSGVDRFANC